MSASQILPLVGMSRPARWVVLLLISALVTAPLEMVHLPAALMLGPLVAGILVEIGGGSVRVPRIPLNAAQVVIGFMIARAITPSIIGEFGRQWPLFLGIVSVTVFAASVLGYLISRLGILQGTTAIWGIMPGAATAMMLMAEAYGADFRLVASMQYMRVVVVAVTASLVGSLWAPTGAGMAATAHGTIWFPEIHGAAFAGTLGLAAVSLVLGLWSKRPVGVLIAGIAVGSVVHVTGLATIELPPWFLAIAYALIGWNAGLRFTRDVLAAIARALPQTLVAIMVMIVFCAGLAGLLVKVLGVDPLTAYLATSPGGIDSVAIIAASTKVDTSFVMALQTVRLLLLLVLGPPISKFVAGLVPASAVDLSPPAASDEIRTLEEAARNDVGDLD